MEGLTVKEYIFYNSIKDLIEEEIQRRYEELTEALNEANIQIEAYEEDMKDLKEELEEAQNKVEAYEDRLNDLDSTKEDINTKLYNALNGLREAMEEIEEAQEDINNIDTWTE